MFVPPSMEAQECSSPADNQLSRTEQPKYNLNEDTLYRSHHEDVAGHMLAALFHRGIFFILCTLSRIKFPLQTLHCTNYNLWGNILKNYCLLPVHKCPYNTPASLPPAFPFERWDSAMESSRRIQKDQILACAACLRPLHKRICFFP